MPRRSRPFKLAGTTETRNTCTYCSVACGIIMYSQGRPCEGREGRHHPHRRRRRSPDQSRHAVPEGRGAARHRARRRRARKYPQIRKAGSDKFERVSWDVALDRIARLMKDDRDKNFIAKNNDGVTVNRWLTTGFLAASATTNETAWRDLQGRAQRRNAGLRQSSARLTRPYGSQSGPNIRPRRDDEFVDRYQEHGSRRDHGRQCRRGASVRIQVGHGGESQPWRQADRRRSALSRARRRSPTSMRRSGRAPTSPSCSASSTTASPTTRCSGTTPRPSPTRPTW